MSFSLSPGERGRAIGGRGASLSSAAADQRPRTPRGSAGRASAASSSPAPSGDEDWTMQDVNWVINVLPDMVSEMKDEDVDCFAEIFQEEQEAREAARLRDEGVLEPADVEEAFPRGRGGARRSGGGRSVNPPRERSRKGSSREPTRPGRQQSREPLDPDQPGRWRRRERVRSRSRSGEQGEGG